MRQSVSSAHRAVGLQVGPAVVGEQRHPAAPGHRDRPAGEPPVVDVGPEVPRDPLQPVRVEPDLARLGVHLQLRHDNRPYSGKIAVPGSSRTG